MWKFLLILLVPFVISCGQDFSRFVLIQKDGLRIEGKDGRINDLTFEGIDIDGNLFSVKKDNIKTLYQSTGNKSLLLGTLGFLAGTCTALAVSYNSENQQSHLSAGAVLAFAGAGAIIGALVGGTTQSWEVVPLDNHPSRFSDLMKGNTIIQLSINL
ncbi:MAG: hypothetical protein ACM3QX_14685 [Syntrophomonadaceae bacterium]